MPKLINKIPKLSKRGNGSAYVTIAGKKYSCGKFGTKECQQRYAAIIAEVNSSGLPDPKEKTITVEDLVYAYITEKEKIKWSHLGDFRTVARICVRLYGNIPCEEFSPKKFKAVRSELCNSGYRITYVRALMNDVAAMFRWAASEEFIPPSVPYALSTVPKLKEGEAAPAVPRNEAPLEDILCLIPFCSPMIADMVRLQYETAMRPSEMFRLRMADVRMFDGVPFYCPPSFKTKKKGGVRNIVLNAKAWEIVQRRSIDKEADEPLFSPKENKAEMRTICNTSPEDVRAPHWRLSMRTMTDKTNMEYVHYWSGLVGAERIARANGIIIEHWSSYQLRHAGISRVREELGIEVAQYFAGHSSPKTTEIYSHRQIEIAARVAKAEK